jgi:predicted Zn-ribbon and HTH transcriptional regulator
MVIPFGISTRFQEYEKLTGAMIYWTPHLVWACHNCAHRWLAEGLKYPEKCPKCNSEHWDERKDYAEPGRRHRIAK